MDAVKAWKDEERRQAQLLSDAVNDAIVKNGAALSAAGTAPILNAVFGALAINAAHALAAIGDRRTRRAMRDAFERAIDEEMKREIERNPAKAETFVIGRPGTTS